MASFSSDIEFCPECGAILPLPGLEDVVTCKVCQYQIDVTEFDGIEIYSEVIFNDTKELSKSTENEPDDYSLPMVDKKCPMCDHDGMTFTTRQTRSADEGQTVFYGCPRCKYQEQEFS